MFIAITALCNNHLNQPVPPGTRLHCAKTTTITVHALLNELYNKKWIVIITETTKFVLAEKK